MKCSQAGLPILMVAASTVLAGSVEAAGTRVALIVGNNAYTHVAALSNPGLDAALLAKVLAANSFEVLSCDGKRAGCFDLGEQDLVKALKLLEQKSKGAELALFFYAGHGMEAGEANVLAPVDAKVDCSSRQLSGGVSIDTVLAAIAPAIAKIVVLDACRNDPLGTICPPTKEVLNPSFKGFKIQQADRFVLVSSTKPGQVALDGLPGQHSPFARALLGALKDSPSIYFHQVFDQVAKAVIVSTEKAGFTQIPEVLIRGGAPEDCLSGKACAADPQAVALRNELDTLRVARARDQELTEIANGYLEVVGVRAVDRPLSDDERKRVLEGLKVAGRALTEFGDSRSEEALQKLKAGQSELAEELFGEVLERQEAAAKAAEERAANRKLDAAKAARQLSALNRPKNIAKSAEYLRRAVALDPSDVQTWIDFGEVARDIGSLVEARTAFEQATQKSNVNTDPVLRTKATYRLSEIAKDLGDLDGAQRWSSKALDLATALADSDIGNTAWQRDLSVALEKVGDVLVGRGNLPEALTVFMQSLKIRFLLASSDPNNIGWQRDLSFAHNKVGEVLVVQGNLEEAEKSFRDGLEIRARLSGSDSGNTEWQRDLAVSEEKIGDVLVALGNLLEAHKVFRDSLAIRDRLAKVNPGNAVRQRDLSVAQEKMGDVLLAQVNLTEALVAFRDSLAIRDRLAKVNPGNAVWQRDLSISHNKVGDVLQAQGNLSAALESYQTSLSIRRGIAKKNPSNAGMQIDVAVGHARLGQVYAKRGDEKEALRSFKAGRKILAPIASRSGNRRWLDYLQSLDADLAKLER